MKINKRELLYGVASMAMVLYVHDGDDTIGHGLTMDIAKSLTIRERTRHACIAHLDLKGF